MNQVKVMATTFLTIAVAFTGCHGDVPQEFAKLCTTACKNIPNSTVDMFSDAFTGRYNCHCSTRHTNVIP